MIEHVSVAPRIGRASEAALSALRVRPWISTASLSVDLYCGSRARAHSTAWRVIRRMIAAGLLMPLGRHRTRGRHATTYALTDAGAQRVFGREARSEKL